MRALILAAGEGTRLRPLTSNIPKPMLPVAGKPYLRHLLRALGAVGIEEALMVVGWRSSRIREYFSDDKRSEGVRITFLEQRERKGTAHAISLGRDHLDGQFLCVNGDVLVSEEDVRGIVNLAQQDSRNVLGAVRVNDPRRFGVIEQRDGKLVSIEEKPETPRGDMINAGMMVLEPGIFRAIEETPLSRRGELEITDTLSLLARRQEVLVYPLNGIWMDLARPWDLLNANELLMERIDGSAEGVVEEGAVLKGKVVVEEEALIRSGSYIEGPAYISSGCDIGPNCHIRPSTYLGEEVRVGNAVEVKNSIIMRGTKIPHHSYVGDSVIGERCNLGSGTKVANLRLDGKLVEVELEDGRLETGRRKLGVIMGDEVRTGINASIDVGTIIWERSFIGPGTVVRGNIGPGSLIL